MNKQGFWLSVVVGLALLLGFGRPVQAAPLTDAQLRQTHEWYRDGQGVIGPRTQQALYQANYRAFQKIKGKPQIAVIVTAGKDEDELQDYANEQFKKYGFGHADWDNGLLLTIEPKEHHYWLEVGYGLEPVVPDGAANQIVTPAVKKQLRADRYDQAIAAIVQNTVRRVQQHQGDIVTPVQIRARRAHEKLVNTLSVSLIIALLLIGVAMAARFFILRNWIGRTLTSNPQTFPILWALNEAGVKLDLDIIPGGGWALFNRQTALTNAFAKLIRRDYIKWLAQVPQLGPLPYYYYRTNDPHLASDLWPAQKLANAQSLTAILADDSPYLSNHKAFSSIKSHTDEELRVVGPYQTHYEAWLKTSGAEPEEASKVWQDFYRHVKPEDADLTNAQLAQLWTVMLNHQRHPEVAQPGDDWMPLWVVSDYAHASAPSGGAGGGFGAGGGGGASGGGGFGGSW